MPMPLFNYSFSSGHLISWILKGNSPLIHIYIEQVPPLEIDIAERLVALRILLPICIKIAPGHVKR
jgi:hypothetical protein